MIRPRSICGVLVVSALLAFLSSRTCAADEIEALRWVPPTCNAVAVVELRSLLNSPLGQRHKWLAEVRAAYAQGELSAPPFVRRIVQATMFDAAGGSKHVTYSIFTTDQDSVIHDVASHELAKTEKIAGHLAAQRLFCATGPGRGGSREAGRSIGGFPMGPRGERRRSADRAATQGGPRIVGRRADRRLRRPDRSAQP
jgi:hypothetical protein